MTGQLCHADARGVWGGGVNPRARRTPHAAVVIATTRRSHLERAALLAHERDADVRRRQQRGELRARALAVGGDRVGVVRLDGRAGDRAAVIDNKRRRRKQERDGVARLLQRQIAPCYAVVHCRYIWDVSGIYLGGGGWRGAVASAQAEAGAGRGCTRGQR